MNKTTLHKLGLLLLAPLVMMGTQCPEFPEIEDVPIVLVTREFIELSFESEGTININTESDSAGINTADVRAQLEEANVSLDSLQAIKLSKVMGGCVVINPEDEAGALRNLTDMTVTANRLDAPGSTTLVQGWRTGNPLFVFPLGCDKQCAGDFAANEDVETIGGGCWIRIPIQATAVDYFNGVLDELLTILKGDPANDRVIRFQGVASGASRPASDFTSFSWKLRIYYDISGYVIVETPRI
jgi:hypothetical protein